MQVHMDYEGRKSRCPMSGRNEEKKGRFWRVNQGVIFWCDSREAAWRVDARL